MPPKIAKNAGSSSKKARSLPVADASTDASPSPLPLILKLVAFVIVGGVGFAVDILATLSLINFGLHPLIARGLAIAVALFTTYVLNRGVTFRKESSTGAKAVAAEGSRYAAVGLGTSALNWAVYALVLAIVPSIGPLVAVVIGSLTAMVASYIGYSRFAFRS